jgi:hypothetical protein
MVCYKFNSRYEVNQKNGNISKLKLLMFNPSNIPNCGFSAGGKLQAANVGVRKKRFN